MTAQDWIYRCAARLREHIQDDEVTLADLRACAHDMLELAPYRDMEPEAAAEQWAHDFA